jgi:hypothetical protein
MHNYAALKTASNASPSAFRFGKLRNIGNSVPSLQEYSIIWCADIGYSFRRAVRCEDRSSQIEQEYISNQNENRYTFDKMSRFLSGSPGQFYSVQCGGCSNIQLLMKIPISSSSVKNSDELLAWNALRFLHRVGWIPATGSEVKTAMNIPMELEKEEIKWLSASEQQALLSAVPVVDINWVWFRRAGYKLTQEIMERATSWIAINPECRFHLWTDIPNKEEYDDFLSAILPEWRDRFLRAVTIHYHEETNGLIESMLDELASEEGAEGIALLRSEFASKERQARVYKTDFARLFILYKRGGVYADFNDLLCLAPVRDLLAVYGIDKPLGVTDLADLNHASNYFMYSPAGCPEWFAILKDMVADVKYLVRMMRDELMMATMRTHVLKTIDACTTSAIVPVDISALPTCFNRNVLPHIGNEMISDALWERMLYVILIDCAPDSLKSALSARLDEIKRPQKGRGKGRAQAATPSFVALSAEDVAVLHAAIDEKYVASYLFWWTDYNLRTLMHFTNLPIYCRMRKIPLHLAPYGYYMSYACMLSWFGHIGDGTSYGMDGRKDVRVEEFYSVTRTG